MPNFISPLSSKELHGPSPWLLAIVIALVMLAMALFTLGNIKPL